MLAYRDVRYDMKTSKEVAEYLQHNDLVILPVGCMEMHGPICPLGCDLFLDDAAALLLARRWKCLALRTIPYVDPGASGPWPGTIDVPPIESINYILAVTRAVIKAGFKRVVLSGMHGPLDGMFRQVASTIFKESRVVVAHISCFGPISKEIEKEFGSSSEDAVLLGALHILGLDGLVDPTTVVDKPCVFPSPVIGPLRQCGMTVPWVFQDDSQHTGIRSDLKPGDGARSAACIRRAIDAMGEAPELYARYQAEIGSLLGDPPWRRADGWSV